jgi:DNA-binding PadR family transcriptional regulator
MPARKDGHSTGRRVDACPDDGGLAGDGGAPRGSVTEEKPVVNETEQLAEAVLRAVNRAQAKGSTVRLVVPRAPEVAYEMDIELPEDRLMKVEEYLQDYGYIVPVDIGLPSGTYTMTPAGLEWLDAVASEQLEAPREEATRPSEWTEPRPSTNDTREDTEKRPQGRMPRRLQRELNKARKQLEERPKERGWRRRMFGV